MSQSSWSFGTQIRSRGEIPLVGLIGHLPAVVNRLHSHVIETHRAACRARSRRRCPVPGGGPRRARDEVDATRIRAAGPVRWWRRSSASYPHAPTQPGSGLSAAQHGKDQCTERRCGHPKSKASRTHTSGVGRFSPAIERLPLCPPERAQWLARARGPRDGTGVVPGENARRGFPVTSIRDSSGCLAGFRRVWDQPENATAATQARVGRVCHMERLKLTTLLAYRVGERLVQCPHGGDIG
jgi:hypothetical protein